MESNTSGYCGGVLAGAVIRYQCSFALALMALAIAFAVPAEAAAPYPPSPVITDIEWGSDINLGTDCDNWPCTWADDGHMYAAGGDGTGFGGTRKSSWICRITGNPWQGTPTGTNISDLGTGDGSSGKKASGLLCVNGVVYMWVRNADGNGKTCQLAWSDDHCSTWNWGLTFSEFGYCAFINFGQDYASARDNYVYTVSHDNPSAYTAADHFVLMRVPKGSITTKSAYEFLKQVDGNGNPVWTSDISQRGAAFTNAGKCMRSGMSYDAKIGRYLWWQQDPTTGDTRFEGNFGIYDAPEPWGPWTTVYEGYWNNPGPGDGANFPTKWMRDVTGNTQELYLVFAGNDHFMIRKATLTISVSDTTPPTIVSVSCSGGGTEVVVVYSEPVEESSATTVANYSIDNDIAISAAALGADLKTVTLTTSAHAEGVTYTLTVNNVTDRATTPNTIAADTTKTYEYVPQVEVTNVNQSGYTTGILHVGELCYVDRTFTFSDVATLDGEVYILTANDDKLSTGDSFLTFDVDQDVTVYVAHDDRLTTKPSWLDDFTDTGNDLLGEGGPEGFSLFAKDFAAGTVTLGGNYGVSDSSMYSVVIAAKDTAPPSPFNLTGPPDAAENVGVTPTLSWQAASGAETYTVTVATDESMTTVVHGQAGVTGTTHAVPAAILDYDTVYYWDVTAHNAAGDTPSTNGRWSFNPSKAGAPEVTGTDPGHEERGVDVSAGMEVHFSEPMATATEGAISVTDAGGGGVPGAAALSGMDMVLTFVPEDDLDYEATYTVTIDGATATDRAVPANSLAADYVFTFTTQKVFTGVAKGNGCTLGAGAGGVGWLLLALAAVALRKRRS